MLGLQDARSLLEALMQAIKPLPPESGLQGRRRIPRPPLVLGQWGDFDLQAATLPLVERMAPEELHEAFSAFLEIHLAKLEEPLESAFATVHNTFQLHPNDVALLFPNRRGPTLHTEQDVAYALGIFLWCAKAMGYALSYGKDFALVQAGEITFGVQNSVAVCGYPSLCLPVVDTDWVQFYEGPRDGDGNAPDELYLLYLRSRSRALDDYQALTHAVQTVTWASRKNLQAIAAEASALSPTPSINRHAALNIKRRVRRVAQPIKKLEEILVPKYTTLSTYRQVVVPYRYDEAIWEGPDVDAFVDEVMAKLGLSKNNKKGKTHASSNHRKGRRR